MVGNCSPPVNRILSGLRSALRFFGHRREKILDMVTPEFESNTAGASALLRPPNGVLRREGRADRGADRKAGVGGRAHRRAGRTHRGPGGAAQPPNPAAEDPRQFIEAALARTQARPPGTWCRSPAAPKRPRCRSDAASEPGSHDRPAADHLPEMPSGVSGRVANPAAGL